jgi:hypothetical protein
MTEVKGSERLQIILTDDEIAALDDWRFANRMPTRAAAIRELMKRGMMAQEGDGTAKRYRKSRDVRLVERPHVAHGNGARGNGAEAD